jgi:hypothetical protein
MPLLPPVTMHVLPARGRAWSPAGGAAMQRAAGRRCTPRAAQNGWDLFGRTPPPSAALPGAVHASAPSERARRFSSRAAIERARRGTKGTCVVATSSVPSTGTASCPKESPHYVIQAGGGGAAGRGRRRRRSRARAARGGHAGGDAAGRGLRGGPLLHPARVQGQERAAGLRHPPGPERHRLAALLRRRGPGHGARGAAHAPWRRGWVWVRGESEARPGAATPRHGAPAA